MQRKPQPDPKPSAGLKTCQYCGMNFAARGINSHERKCGREQQEDRDLAELLEAERQRGYDSLGFVAFAGASALPSRESTGGLAPLEMDLPFPTRHWREQQMLRNQPLNSLPPQSSESKSTSVNSSTPSLSSAASTVATASTASRLPTPVLDSPPTSKNSDSCLWGTKNYVMHQPGVRKRVEIVSLEGQGCGFATPPATRIDGFQPILPAHQSFQKSTWATLSTNTADPTNNLYSQYTESLTRRTESRVSQGCSSAPRRERSLLKPGAEGKLLVPDIKLKVPASRRTSLSNVNAGLRPVGRSPLSTLGSVSGEDAPPKCPTTEAHSWSYHDKFTYPLMEHPKNISRRKEKHIVGGNEVEVEIEVELPPKRLFLFPPSIHHSNHRS